VHTEESWNQPDSWKKDNVMLDNISNI